MPHNVQQPASERCSNNDLAVADRQAPDTTRRHERALGQMCGRRRRQMCALMQVNQRVLGPRRNQLAGSAASHAHGAHLLLPKTLKRAILAP
jgi:hypothetical protein